MDVSNIPENELKNFGFVMSFLNQALADKDIEAFQLSQKDIIRIHVKVSELAKEVKRAGRRSFDSNDPDLYT